MSPLIILLVVAGTIVLCSEFILWRLFLRRTRGISFPRETDMSALRFFSVHRVRIAALLHTIFLLVWISVFLLILW